MHLICYYIFGQIMVEVNDSPAAISIFFLFIFYYYTISVQNRQQSLSLSIFYSMVINFQLLLVLPDQVVL